MAPIFAMKNIVQNYVWGSKTELKRLFDIQNPENLPQAEVWMGAHPKASSTILVEGKQLSLLDFVTNNPEKALGKEGAKQFENRLPFLFKILCANEALSIQAHPNLAQAKSGFNRENLLGIPLSNPERNYKDDNHKPEILCALTPFKALRGFRRANQIYEFLSPLKVVALNQVVSPLKENLNDDLKVFYTSLMNLSKEVATEAIKECGRLAKESKLPNSNLYQEVVELAKVYPGDIGTLGPLFLNFIELKPGEAIFLDAGQLHAYLSGTGIELMANSDNVLRGGMTIKHVDLNELNSTLSFSPSDPIILKGEPFQNKNRFNTPAKEFVLSTMTITNAKTHIIKREEKPSIFLVTEGVALVTAGTTQLEISKGNSCFVPADTKELSISGDATLFEASF